MYKSLCCGVSREPQITHTLVCLSALLPTCPQTSTFRKELEELREMKEDVERREKAQAEVISQQVRSVQFG